MYCKERKRERKKERESVTNIHIYIYALINVIKTFYLKSVRYTCAFFN